MKFWISLSLYIICGYPLTTACNPKQHLDMHFKNNVEGLTFDHSIKGSKLLKNNKENIYNQIIENSKLALDTRYYIFYLILGFSLTIIGTVTCIFVGYKSFKIIYSHVRKQARNAAIRQYELDRA